MLTKNTARRRAGFTLIETIVTVGLLAVIAAFVIPTVIQKAGVGDPVKVQNDLNSVRTAIETFATDSKAGFPHQISWLTSKPVANSSRLIDSTAMTLNQVTAWNGPYIGATMSAVPGDSLATGYTAYIMNFLDRYDILNNVPEHNASGAVSPTFSATGTLFAGVQIHGLTFNQATALNKLIDGISDPNLADSSNTSGRFRFGTPTSGVVIAHYLAVPITQ
jgi:prepilin-type N-terminal cleavage/methylation domain-containing protein